MDDVDDMNTAVFTACLFNVHVNSFIFFYKCNIGICCIHIYVSVFIFRGLTFRNILSEGFERKFCQYSFTQLAVLLVMGPQGVRCVKLCSLPMIATKICTWHDSCAVVTCAKICSDLMAKNGIITKWRHQAITWMLTCNQQSSVVFIRGQFHQRFINHQSLKLV